MIELVVGDLTVEATDAVVLPANPELLPGGGASGALHRAGGPQIAAECAALGGCAVGDARATSAGRLPARFVVHAVGPVWRGGDHGEAALLASAYRRSLQVAAGLGCRSIALPAISCGIYGYPPEQAARVALPAVAEALPRSPGIERARFVFLDESLRRVFVDAAEALGIAVIG